MSKWMLAAGAAALAIAAPALADKGGNHGGGNHGGGGQKAERGGGGGNQSAKAKHGGGKQHVQHTQVAKHGDHKGGHAKAQSFASHGKGGGNDKVARVEAGHGKARVDTVHGRGVDHVKMVGNDKHDRLVDNGRDLHAARFDRVNDRSFIPRWNEHGLVRGFEGGCPPGLAKKGNGCLPPGQARKIVGTPLAAALSGRVLEGPYRQWYRDDDRFMYRWDDDYIYRVNRSNSLVDALFPYQNRDYYYYPVGLNYPVDYNYYNVPYQYQTYYPDGGAYSYRYGDGAIYQVNPGTGLIQGIAALLTGNSLAVGQPLPPTYGVYNVPFDYRDQYYDTADNWYRYNDGYIYRVDPTTQLITAVINAIV